MVSLGTCREERRHARATTAFASTARSRIQTVTPLGLGYRNAQGVQVSGGTEAVRYFMSAGRDDEIGVFKLDDYEKHRFDSLGITIHPWQMRPNTRLLNNFRGNISAQVNPQFDAALNFGYSTVERADAATNRTTRSVSARRRSADPGYRNNGLISGIAGLARRLPRRNARNDLGGEAPAERQPHDSQRRT